MEDGVDVRGCIGEEARPGWNAWGGGLPVVWGGILINNKNREMGGPFALDGRRLMGGHNNKPKVGIDGGRGIEEERRPGRNVWGVWECLTAVCKALSLADAKGKGTDGLVIRS